MTQDINDPLAALRSELANVAPSEEFAARVKQRVMSERDELAMLRDELANVTPSPAFAARVRQRLDVADEHTARRWFWTIVTWRWAVPVAGVTAVAVLSLTMVARVPQVPQVPQVARVPQVSQGLPAPQVASAPTVVGRPFKAGDQSLATVVGRPFRAGGQRASIESRTVDPFLHVITDQPAILRKLADPLEAPGISVDATEPTGPAEVPKIDVVPLAVSPIAVFLVVDPRIPVGAPPTIRRVAADPAERSSK